MRGGLKFIWNRVHPDSALPSTPRRALRPEWICALTLLTLATACGPVQKDDKLDVTSNQRPMVLAPGWVIGTAWPTQTVVALNSVHAQRTSYVEGDVAVITM